MKKYIVRFALCFAVLGISQGVSAQGFLKKLAKNVTEVTKTDDANKDQAASTDTISDKLKESEFPEYYCKKVYETDANGVQLKNEDGTPKFSVHLFDKDGNLVNSEYVEAQTKQINEAVLAVAVKVAASVGIGALTGKGKGALIGLAAGLGLSINDIKTIVKLKKAASKQKKTLETYKQNFTENGEPRAAEIDANTLKELGLDEKNAVTMETQKIKESLQKELQTNQTIETLKGLDLGSLI